MVAISLALNAYLPELPSAWYRCSNGKWGLLRRGALLNSSFLASQLRWSCGGGAGAGDPDTKLVASTGAIIGNYRTYPDGPSGVSKPSGIAFDGFNIWVINNKYNGVVELQASTGSVINGAYVGNQPSGIAFDGANLWVVNSGDGTVTKVPAATGSTLGSYAVGSQPNGIAFDGSTMWVTNSASNSVSKLPTQ